MHYTADTRLTIVDRALLATALQLQADGALNLNSFVDQADRLGAHDPDRALDQLSKAGYLIEGDSTNLTVYAESIVRGSGPDDVSFRSRWRKAALNSSHDLPTVARLILAILSLDMDENGKVQELTMSAIAGRGFTSERTVRTHLSAAEEAGWFVRRKRSTLGRPGRCYDYYATLPGESKTSRQARLVRARYSETID